MNKATSTLIAAFAALTLSGGAYAQAAGGSNGGGTSGSTASPSNQMNGATSGYGTPGTPNSESGMAGSPIRACSFTRRAGITIRAPHCEGKE